MAKSKAPTPQEIYRQRKLREEKERTAFLPPGLINHGNTCFMNSVLQGLIATRLLADLIYFNPIPEEIQRTAATTIVSTRSPQLTNGHVFAGQYKLPYVDTMPIGDAFLATVYKAWGLQAGRRREVLSPRNLLATLGRKYDQYLDFAQQDAHEFLRILLDAMRMEEFDIIKKRQPPQPPKKRRRTTITPSIVRESQDSVTSYLSTQLDIATSPPDSHSAQSTLLDDSPDDPLPLMSFVDMVFGGRLTSILVCQKCKHVSQTYEDFNDISLSLKPEDYQHRKRDRLKKFVGRFTAFPGTSAASAHKDKPPIPTSGSQIVPNHTIEVLRSASNPSALNGGPKLPGGSLEELNGEVLKSPHQGNATGLSAPAESTAESSASTSLTVLAESSQEDEANDGSDSSHVIVSASEQDEKRVEFAEPPKAAEKEQKEKKEDSWVKIGRRISLNIGLGRPKDKEKEKDKKDRDRKARSMDRGFLSVAAIKEAVTAETTSIPKSQSGSVLSPGTKEDVQKMRVSSDSVLRSSISSSAAEASSCKPERSSPLQPTRSNASIPSSSRLASSPRPSISVEPPLPSSKPPSGPRPKSPKPPKPSSAEQEYLRKILADVASPSASPFTIFRPPLTHRHTSDHSTSSTSDKEKGASAAWLGLGGRPFSGLEECLRMFTSVEVLDGENMVGCRRCWKIQNNALSSHKREDSDADEEEDEPISVQEPSPEVSGRKDVERMQHPPLKVLPASLNLSTATPGSPVQLHASHSTPTVSFYAHPNTRSITSLPMSVSDVNLSSSKESDVHDERPDSPSSLSLASEASVTTAQTTESDSQLRQGPGGMPIPVIFTTSTDISATTESTLNESGSDSHYSSASEGPSHSSEALMMAAAVSAVNGRHLPNTYHMSPSKDSLVIPPRPRFSHRRATTSDVSITTDDGSSGDESDTSVGTSVSGESANEASSAADAASALKQASPSANPSTNQEPAKPHKKPSKPKPTIMRPAYKRYLIATPPPILVIHLKRFQQTTKSPLMMSFSHGFKKLDDYISFPEHLDLSPFLAPRKEDYGLGRKGKKAGAKKEKDGHHKDERCMYRLYAVVVHIGNMLGGHYVAYTALPIEPPLHQSSSSSPSPPDPAAASSSSADTNAQTSEKSTTSSAHGHDRPTERDWAYISDTTVRLTTLDEVLSQKAYLCLYERC